MAKTRAFTLAVSQLWAITEPALQNILAIAARLNASPQAVEAEIGKPLENSYTVMVRDGVAIIPVSGPIFRRANLFTQISGATSTELLARDFTKALNDGSIKAIVFSIDSPGGEANGINELAEMIYAARGKKPMCAYVGGIGASAAYWLASAADEIVMDDTALVGSIGVVSAYPKPESDDEATEVEFVSSQSPNKRPNPTEDTGRAQIQKMVDDMAAVFVDRVARNRGVSRKAVLRDFGAGGMRMGQEAVDVGLADRLGSFEQMIAEYGSGSMPMPHKRDMPMPMPMPDDDYQDATGAISAPVAIAGTTVPGGAAITYRSNTMADNKQAAPEAMPTPAVNLNAPPALNVDDARLQAQLDAYTSQYAEQLQTQLQARYEAQLQQAMEQARLQFERQMAEAQAKQRIETYAHNVTNPSLDRRHALPFKAEEVSTLLMSLGADQRKAVTGLFDRLLESGLVSFEEIGSTGEGEQERDAADQWNAAVSAKVATGLSRATAIEQVMKESPALYREYSAGSTKRGGR